MPTYEAFHNKLRKSNPLEEEYLDSEKPIVCGLTTETALVEMKLSGKPPNRAENYFDLQKVWQQEKMQSFKDFLRWCTNKDVPTPEATQKMVEFYHNKSIDMLKLGCTLPNLANICLHISTGAKFHPFTEND